MLAEVNSIQNNHQDAWWGILI